MKKNALLHDYFQEDVYMAQADASCKVLTIQLFSVTCRFLLESCKFFSFYYQHSSYTIYFLLYTDDVVNRDS